MSQIDDDIIWQMKPHTEAKHEILKNYLHRWFPILSTVSGRVVYIDGFAGPGLYLDGEEGSTLIALRAADEHILKPHSRTEMIFIFIESIEKRARFLKSVLEEKFPELPEKIVYDVISAEFEPTINALLDGLEKDGSQLAPTFAFIDPFGFTGFPMYLLKRLLKHEKSEVLITFMAGFIKRFTDELREDALDKLFGTEEWRKIRDYEGAKEQPLLELYEKQLKNECDSIEYVKSFGFRGEALASISAVSRVTLTTKLRANKSGIGVCVCHEAGGIKSKNPVACGEGTNILVSDLFYNTPVRKKFLKQAKNYLNKNGVIFMEFDPPQKIEIEKILKKYKYNSRKFYKDQFGKWRWVEIS